MLDTLTKPSTQLKALKLVPEGASIKKSDIPFNGTFILRNKVNSFFDRSQKQFLEVPLKINPSKYSFTDCYQGRYDDYPTEPHHSLFSHSS
jgi:hypothetical protein